MHRMLSATPRRSDPSDHAPLSPVPVRLWLALVGMTALAVAVLAYRIWDTGESGNLSLILDLFLAWVPVPPAYLIYRLTRRPVPPKVLVLGLATLWLLFFPNAPYLITEPIHLTSLHGPSTRPMPGWLMEVFGSRPRQPAPEWLDLLLLMVVAACGAMLAFTSLRLVHLSLPRRLGVRGTAAALCGLILLGSFGVALGRFDRFNSWDVFHEPVRVVRRVGRRVIRPTDEPGVTACTIVFTTMLTLGYFGTLDLGRRREGDV
jgi:uncharacterized membrane protein